MSPKQGASLQVRVPQVEGLPKNLQLRIRLSGVHPLVRWQKHLPKILARDARTGMLQLLPPARTSD